MDKGIIFSAAMVRALLDGRKTQTRRLLRLPTKTHSGGVIYERKDMGGWEPTTNGGGGCFTIGKNGEKVPAPEKIGIWHRTCGVCMDAPYQVGDRLYVREACFATEMADDEGRDGVMFLADTEFVPIENEPSAGIQWLKLFHYGQKAGESPSGMRGKSVPSIHMPRWASRLTLLVTDVRVQRVAEIGSDDAEAEGIERHDIARGWKNYRDDRLWCAAPETSFESLWNSLHTKPGERWEDNPFVVAVTFEVRQGNIDRIGQ